MICDVVVPQSIEVYLCHAPTSLKPEFSEKLVLQSFKHFIDMLLWAFILPFFVKKKKKEGIAEWNKSNGQHISRTRVERY